MDRSVQSYRIRRDLIGWVKSYATERETTQAVVLEAAVEAFKALAESGVPDLPVADSASAKAKRSALARPSNLEPVPDPAESWHALASARQAALNAAKYRRAS